MTTRRMQIAMLFSIKFSIRRAGPFTTAMENCWFLINLPMILPLSQEEVVNLDTLDLCRTLNITQAQFLKIISDMKDRRRNPGYSKYTNQLFMAQLSAEESGVFARKAV